MNETSETLETNQLVKMVCGLGPRMVVCPPNASTLASERRCMWWGEDNTLHKANFPKAMLKKIERDGRDDDYTMGRR